MHTLILITSDPFVESVSEGLKANKPYINYWTNGVLPEESFDQVEIFNGEKLVVRGKCKSMDIRPLAEAYALYDPECGGMLPSLDALKAMLNRVFGYLPDPIGNIILEDFSFDPEGLDCTHPYRSTQKFTYAEVKTDQTV